MRRLLFRIAEYVQKIIFLAACSKLMPGKSFHLLHSKKYPVSQDLAGNCMENPFTIRQLRSISSE